VEGIIYVQILWDLNGSVMQTRLARSSQNQSFEDAAVEGAQKFKFTPGKQRDKAVPV
jgi:TonB family protein